MVMGKRGTEKPIEIFVALFVILAVSLVTLRLFQNQVTQQQQQIQSFEEEQEQKELLERASAHCTQACTAANRNSDCSLQGLASLCITYGSEVIDDPKYLDLNSDKERGVDTSKLAGIGLCENHVPCHALVGECCDREITAKSCEDILTRYWSNQGFNRSERADLFQQEWKGGTCSPNGQTMWWNQTSVSDQVCTDASCI